MPSPDVKDPRELRKEIVEAHRPDLARFEEIYKDIHSNPELGTQEVRTSGIVAKHVHDLKLQVHERIGGHGVVGVLENGPGTTLLLRADMDALPIREQTGFPYASNIIRVDPTGVERPVMHACGHDMHTTALMAVATLLNNAKHLWTGTVIFLWQPDEEHGAGARAMIADGLYRLVPTPDIVLGQHLETYKTGTVAIRAGLVLTSADSFDVRIFGRGGHASQPQNTIDPVVIASFIIVRLQSIVSREVAPQKMAVISCGSIHGGDTENVIPDHVDLKLNIRTFDPAVRNQVLTAVKRVIESECGASGVAKAPIITPTTHFPATDNSAALVGALRDTWMPFFGADNVVDMEPDTASEDIMELANAISRPCAFWYVGSTEAEKWDEADSHGRLSDLPGVHSPNFAPVIQPTLKTAVDALSLAALRFLAQ